MPDPDPMSMDRALAVVAAINAASQGTTRGGIPSLKGHLHLAHTERLRHAISRLQPCDDVIIAGHSYSLPHLQVMLTKLVAAENALQDAVKALCANPEDLVPRGESDDHE